MSFSNSEIAEIQAWIKGILSGNRATLGRALTLVESTIPKHQILAGKILNELLPFTGNSVRIGITGSPGVGKSTFINAFGDYLINQHNKKVAVLAIDPSSTKTYGSILGDKTRMPELSVSEKAFIRPSPSAGDLGGVAARTRESILVCEAAGYDVILVETVGVGQSETAVHQMVDFFLLLILPGAGDDLQGIKRGIVEMADAIGVNKSDGDNHLRAKEAINFYKQALQLSHSTRPDWKVEVKMLSALEGIGIAEIWSVLTEFEKTQKANNGWFENRSTQNVNWFDNHIDQAFKRFIHHSEKLKTFRESVLEDIKSGKIHPLLAAEEVVKVVLGGC